MKMKKRHPNFILPTRGSEAAGGLDLYMPEAGECDDRTTKVGLGFSAAVPKGNVALLLPRSGTGAKFGLELNNTCGVIDADYRGEWIANLRTKNGERFSWDAGERVLQMVVVPAVYVTPELVDELDDTERGEGGFGDSGRY
ncbi:dUTP diphosphatase [Larsenimonas suaedae]|uniref:dUTP diphosphatase n=1 Tax=Larsenimonas suaedae TaxID=1851019 RepID=A0ABU1GYY9_9GAMM|nr:dUTP diphosphatase [Larsenimonas suaedae]MCM2973733.1 dUTP diphosphatase [Larsenimonas suaedae]MDR5897256.1 dUTP diphosphatase [Larsenimonas suaedae]